MSLVDKWQVSRGKEKWYKQRESFEKHMIFFTEESGNNDLEWRRVSMLFGFRKNRQVPLESNKEKEDLFWRTAFHLWRKWEGMLGEKIENKGKHTAFREEMEVNGDNDIVAHYGKQQVGSGQEVVSGKRLGELSLWMLTVIMQG